MLNAIINLLFDTRKKYGPTSARPGNMAVSDTGYQYFDTDLGLPLCWNGHNWISHDGTQR